MGLVDNGNGNGMVMPVSPMNGAYGGSGWGSDFWLVILFLFAFMGNGNWSNGGTNTAADVQRGFDQQAIMSGITGISTAMNSGFANAEVARCSSDFAIMQALNNGFRDNMANENTNSQKLMDKICQVEMDGIKRDYENRIEVLRAQNAALTNQNNELSRRASQDAQTAAIIANNEAQTAALEQYLAPTPRPAWIVQNPNCCSTNWNACGCGNNMVA